MKKRIISHWVYACIALLFSCTSMYGQLDVQQLTEQQGLGNNTINEIHQDKRGFLWIGTDIGITRYDGNFFQTYNLSNPKGREPISVNNIEETQDKYLWIKYEEGIITCFDKIQEKFLPIQWENGIKQEDVKQIYSSGDTLYAIMPDGLYMLNVKSTGKTIELNRQVLIQNKRLNMVLGSQDHVLFLTERNGQFIAFNVQTKKSDVIETQSWGITPDEINHTYIYNNHLFICGQFEGIICYGLKEKSFRRITISNNQSDYKQPSINEICYLKDNQFAISNKRFIYELKFEQPDYLHTNYDISRKVQYERQFEQLIRNRISRLYYDKDNHVLWIGTNGNGLIRQNISHTYAYPIQLQENIYHINNIVQDAQGFIWLGTRKHGILKSTQAELSQETQFVNWNKADQDDSYHLQKDRNGYIWIGSENGIIQKFNPSTQELTDIALPDTILKQDVCVTNLFMNSRNRLWIATEKSIGIYDENINQWLVFKHYIPQYGKVKCIVEDAEGTMWLGTEKGVYEAFVPLDTPNTISLTGGFEKERGLTANEVLSMHVTNTNQILVAYSDKIIRLEKNKIINHILLKEDIPYGHITCMIDDRNGSTWLGSNESLIAIHNKTNTYFAYPMSGNNPTVCRMNDSKLLWGNMPDLLYFDPIKLKDLKKKKVYITGIEINARKAQLENQAVYDTHEINLVKGDHVKIQFSKLNYNPIQNKTAYRVLPIDTLWRENHYNEIILDKIKAGTYTLQIKPVYPIPGGEEITSLKLKFSYHWAFGPMAMIGYSLAVMSCGILIYRYLHKKKIRRNFYINRHKEVKHELEETKQRNKQERKIHELRNNILASIAQDLRTPLSIILNLLKEVTNNQALSTDTKKRAQLAYRNSLYIQDACDQFIGIQKQSLFQAQLKVSPCPIYLITDSVIRASREIISSCPINIDYGQHKDSTTLWVDFTKVEFIIKNMLSNAFRRIHYAGNIECSIARETINNVEYCVFRIIDDGKGMESLTSQNHIWGQSLMKEIAHRHHGNFRIIQKTNEGTESLLYIPLGKQHFENDEYVVFEENIQLPEEEEPIVLPTHQQEEESTNTKSSSNKPKILIVEEHKDTRMFLKMQFANDFTVYLAKNGKEGIELACQLAPNLIISETILPIIDGFELTRTIKENMETCHIPIILLTTQTNNEDIIKGMELGADDYIRKPFDIEVLTSKIKRLIKSRSELKRSYTKLLVPATNKEEVETSENQGQENVNMEDPLVTKVIQLINENIQNEDFSVKKLAEMLHMSQPTLYRKIKQLTNFTLIEVVRGVRLKRAAELLKSQKYNVQEAAEAVGYNDIPTFRKHFVDLYGTTPSAFSKEEVNEKK